MPIISPIEAKHPRGRLLHAAMFVALTLGAVTMVYPFLLMISGSLRSEMDEADLDLVPAYLADRDALYRKLLEFKYNEYVTHLNRSHPKYAFFFRSAAVPERVNRREVEEFSRFVAESHFPQQWRVGGGMYSAKGYPSRLRELHETLRDRFGGSLEAYGKAVGSPLQQWNLVRLWPPEWQSRQFDYRPNALWEAYFAVTDRAPLAEQEVVSLTGFFLESEIYPAYGYTSTAAYNAAHARPLNSFGEFALPAKVPEEKVDPKLREEWVRFVREEVNPAFIVIDGVPAATYQQLLRDRYGTIDALNKAWNANLADFAAIALPAGQWLRGVERQDYIEFLQQQRPESYRLIGPEFAWRDWLRQHYRTIGEMNAAYGSQEADFDHVRMPGDQLEYAYASDHARELRWRFATSNYRYVWGELFTYANGFRNTFILCALAVSAAVLVNPLAAYALSRYRLHGTYNVLLILMATVAFPPMVTLIPSFILLRKLELTNTFAALVLPFAANGYLIFLLKSFFDSLPRELYEAAAIDGASELRMFWQITMSLSRPILAVVALEAFLAAYTMFLYPLIVCPRPDMWVQTVWLSQFQQRASTSAMFAAVLITCIPTLVIFILAQRVIMRGIIVPTEK